MWFGPHDGTLLQIQTNATTHQTNANTHYFACTTCPHSQPITTPQIQNHTPHVKVDDILGGENAWDNVDRTMVVCLAFSLEMCIFCRCKFVVWMSP
eukprot:CCRYP_014036-RA/>CCRYP_014036-RA protein AED:0.25 eAED:0.25 QI:0/0/0/1/0/0/2/0/95